MVSNNYLCFANIMLYKDILSSASLSMISWDDFDYCRWA